MSRNLVIALAALAVAALTIRPVHDFTTGLLNLAHGDPVNQGWWWIY